MNNSLDYNSKDTQHREHRNEYNYNSQPQHVPQPSQSSGSLNATSPSSPFAFAPPPLSSSLPTEAGSHHRSAMYFSENTSTASLPTYASKQQQQQPPMAHSSSYPFSSAPMGFRSYSNESGQQRGAASPAPSNMNKTPSGMSMHPTLPGISSPLSAPLNSPYAYNNNNSSNNGSNGRQLNGQNSYNGGMPSPQQRPAAYPYIQSMDMPRSLTYPSYAQPYPSPSYHPSMSSPSLHTPSVPTGLSRHHTDGEVMPSTRPPMGYSFANRLPLVDRPFKCDECVQSFNRNHDLKRHKRIHLAVKPFGCDKCGKTFSRKDALRRHWLVKGCRGEEGATASIIPMFPITAAGASRLPPLSPPTPPGSHLPLPGGNHNDDLYHSHASSSTHSFNRALAPPPLHTMPTRTPSTRSAASQVIVTPNETGENNPMGRSQQQHLPSVIHLEEPIVIDQHQPMNASSSIQGHNTPPNGGSGGAGGEQGEYFDMNLKTGASHVNMLSPPMQSPAHTSPFSRSFPSPSAARSSAGQQHPYRRPNGASASPARMTSDLHNGNNGNGDGKPIFAVPFTPDGYVNQSGGTEMQHAMSNGGDAKMERVPSGDSDPSTWQRWHRPSFPFPQPGGLTYQYDQSSPVEVANNYGS